MLTDAPITAVVATTDLDRARDFYEGKLGLRAEAMDMPGEAAQELAMYACGGGSTLLVYVRETAGDSAATSATFRVDDVEATVAELRGRGVQFEDYDTGDVRTHDGILTLGDFRAAWFKDPDGNILGINS
jgi:catechol 2,3-dioxygenase-like lactoylglutathione lyase family enzyme